MTTKQWALVVIGALALTGVLSHFQWFKCYEYVAIWLEGIALVLIFGLDFFERARQDKERKEQQAQWVEQMELSRSQLKAVTDAALAAKKSADIQSALHRPLVGLEPPTMRGADINRSLWTIPLVIRNHGTLAAFNVSMHLEFSVDNALRKPVWAPKSVQIFPGAMYATTVDYEWDDQERQALLNAKKTFTIAVTIRYEAENGRLSTFTVDAQYNRGDFILDNSRTTDMERTIPRD